MQMIERIVTEFFMIVLCFTASPSEEGDIHIDIVDNTGHIGALVIRREDSGFAVYEPKDGNLDPVGRSIQEEGKDYAFSWTAKSGPSEEVYLSQAIEDFDPTTLRENDSLILNTADGGKIFIQRSNGLIFITPEHLNRTYVVR